MPDVSGPGVRRATRIRVIEFWPAPENCLPAMESAIRRYALWPRRPVGSALVHHYFGTKEKLFAAAVRVPIDPMAVIGPLREVPVEELGYKIPSILLPLWDSEIGAGFIATLRSVLAGSEVNLFRAFIQDIIAVEVGSRVDNPPGSGIIRIQFAASQLVGVVMARYILELEPFKTLPVEQIAQTIAPNLQRYLTGDLPELPSR